MNAIVFGAYGNASRYLEGAAPWLNDMSKYGIPTVAGMWGGFLQCVVIAPTELIKCKLQACSLCAWLSAYAHVVLTVLCVATGANV